MKRPPRGGVYRSPPSYPKGWDALAKSVKERDGHRCQQCKRDRKALAVLSQQLGVRIGLQTHHIVSVRSKNNSGRNLVTLCELCHARQPGHQHLMKNLIRRGMKGGKGPNG